MDTHNYPGEAVRGTGTYQCIGQIPSGGMCPEKRTFTRAKGNKFTACPRQHTDTGLWWLGPIND